MYNQEIEEKIVLINRHKAKLLTKLEGINTPEAYIELVKAQFYHLITEMKEGKRGIYGTREEQ